MTWWHNCVLTEVHHWALFPAIIGGSLSHTQIIFPVNFPSVTSGAEKVDDSNDEDVSSVEVSFFREQNFEWNNTRRAGKKKGSALSTSYPLS